MSSAGGAVITGVSVNKATGTSSVVAGQVHVSLQTLFVLTAGWQPVRAAIPIRAEMNSRDVFIVVIFFNGLCRICL